MDLRVLLIVFEVGTTDTYNVHAPPLRLGMYTIKRDSWCMMYTLRKWHLHRQILGVWNRRLESSCKAPQIEGDWATVLAFFTEPHSASEWVPTRDDHSESTILAVPNWYLTLDPPKVGEFPRESTAFGWKQWAQWPVELMTSLSLLQAAESQASSKIKFYNG